jgi:translation initiation factor 1A
MPKDEYEEEEDLEESEEAEEEDEDSETSYITRAPLPRGREIIGIIEERYGGNKMRVSCLDGKERNCRVPGRLKRKLWLRPGDIVIIEPWELDNNKGDILLKYKPSQVEWLKRNSYLKTEKDEF